VILRFLDSNLSVNFITFSNVNFFLWSAVNKQLKVLSQSIGIIGIGSIVIGIDNSFN